MTEAFTLSFDLDRCGGDHHYWFVSYSRSPDVARENDCVMIRGRSNPSGSLVYIESPIGKLYPSSGSHQARRCD